MYGHHCPSHPPHPTRLTPMSSVQIANTTSVSVARARGLAHWAKRRLTLLRRRKSRTLNAENYPYCRSALLRVIDRSCRSLHRLSVRRRRWLSRQAHSLRRAVQHPRFDRCAQDEGVWLPRDRHQPGKWSKRFGSHHGPWSLRQRSMHRPVSRRSQRHRDGRHSEGVQSNNQKLARITSAGAHTCDPPAHPGRREMNPGRLWTDLLQYFTRAAKMHDRYR